MNIWKYARAQWDRTVAGTLFALGALALVVGWVGVSKEALTALQIPYIVSGGLGGIFFLGLGAVFWLSADLRDEWRKLDALERTVASTRNSGIDPLESHWDEALLPVTNGATSEALTRSRSGRSRAKRTSPLQAS